MSWSLTLRRPRTSRDFDTATATLDSQGMPRAIGKVTTAATTQVPVESMAYTPGTAGVKRALKSSNAADAAAGTGARTVRIWYYTIVGANIAGPFVETVTLNGTTAVPTVSSGIDLIDKMEVMTVGSGGVPAGTLSLYPVEGGTGTVIASIAAGDLTTYFAHHYVATGAQCRVTDIEAMGGDETNATLQLKAGPVGGVQQPRTPALPTSGTLPLQLTFPDSAHNPIAGPAIIVATVTPGNTDSQTTLASFGYVDQRVDLTL